MKKIFFLFSFLFVLFSCETDEKNLVDATAKLDAKFASFTGSIISYEDNDKNVVKVSDGKLMQVFKKFVADNKLNLEPLHYKIETIDDKEYLRVYSKNNYVSTVDLIKTDSNRRATGKTVCTSIACASGGGCVPNGDYCTKCVPSGVQEGSGLTGDCTRSTSN